MKTFALSGLFAEEVNTAATRIEQIVITNIVNDSFITKVDVLLKKHLNNLTLSLGRTTDKTLVEQLHAINDVLDTRYLALRDYCAALVSDSDATKATEAKKLVAIIRTIGWSMHHKTASKESSLIASLIDKFGKAPSHASIAAIGAAAKLADLKTAQADFEAAYQDKLDVKTQQEYPKIHDCRVAIARYLGGMIVHVDLLDEIDGGSYTTAGKLIDEVITEFEAIAKSRQTRKDNKDKKKGSTDTDTTK